MGTLSLSQLLCAKEATKQQGKVEKDTAVILIWLDGGPGHMDMYDMKPMHRVSIEGSDGEAVKRPVTFLELFATLYHNLGVDTEQTTINDLDGRPQYLVENDAKPLKELI